MSPRSAQHPRGMMISISLLGALLTGAPVHAAAASGPLVVHPTNPRYFADGTGKAVYLTGSHTWTSLPDEWIASYNITFDFDGYLDFLVAHNHNFIRMWRAEFPQYAYPNDVEYRFSTPHPWVIVSGGGGDPGTPGGGGPGGGGQSGENQGGGPGTGSGGMGTGSEEGDGTGGIAGSGPAVFDLTQFNQAYFDRLRARCIAAGDRGIYVSVMMFEGHALTHASEAWAWHPFNSNNNINSIDGDANNNDSGQEIQTLAIPSIIAVEEAYVRKVIDTINDLDNVMYEISNESAGDSVAWQNHFIDYIHTYEQSKRKQHPVLFSTPLANVGTAIWDSNAEAVSPGTSDAGGAYFSNPPAATGAKVIISDTDHIFGCGGSLDWVWKSFVRGHNVIYMDSYYDDTPFCLPPSEQMRDALGDTRAYALRMNLASTIPHNELTSTTFCLANVGYTYLVYAPNGGTFTVKLNAVSGPIHVEWFNPNTHVTTLKPDVNGGGTVSFTTPFGGSAVLFLHKPGTGNPMDLNNDGVVDIGDLLLLIGNWGPCPPSGACVGDLTGNGTINIDDMLIILGAWS